MARHYHVGSNMVGYMPESDVYTVTSKAAAARAVAEDARQSLYAYQDNLGPDSGPEDRPYKAGNARDGDVYVCRDRQPTTLEIHFWWTPCREPDCRDEEDDSY